MRPGFRTGFVKIGLGEITKAPVGPEITKTLVSKSSTMPATCSVAIIDAGWRQFVAVIRLRVVSGRDRANSRCRRARNGMTSVGRQ